MDGNAPVIPPSEDTQAVAPQGPMTGEDVVSAAAEVVKSDPAVNPDAAPAFTGDDDKTQAAMPSEPTPAPAAPAPEAPVPAPTDAAPAEATPPADNPTPPAA